jgi:glycosyltransferase involved in cell wall biosynthesis
MKLSILIPTLPQRKKMFNILRKNLTAQIDFVHSTHPSLGQVEILFDSSKKFLKGGLSVGAKRDALKCRATGEYLVFVDDDDMIAPNYLESILRLMESNPDIITFRSLYKSSTYWGIVDMNLNHAENEQMNDSTIVKRQPFHVCPIRTSIAQQHSFPDINNAEDWGWMVKVLTDCKTQSHSDQILHQYNEFASVSEVNKIMLSI